MNRITRKFLILDLKIINWKLLNKVHINFKNFLKLKY